MASPFELGNSYLQQGATTAQDVISPESRNRAAARLRADLDTQRNRALQASDDAQASTGGLTSGRANLNRSRIWDGYFSAVGQGLGQIENQEAQNKLQAAGAINQSGTGLNNSAQAQANIKQGALNTYLQGGNALANPTGAGAQSAFGDLGLDVSGLGFFGPQGQTHPFNGTNINNTIGGTSGTFTGTSPGNGANPSQFPTGATPQDIINQILPTLDRTKQYAVSRTRLEQNDPVTTAIYKYLAEQLGIPVKIVAPNDIGYYDVNANYYLQAAGSGGGSIGAA